MFATTTAAKVANPVKGLEEAGRRYHLKDPDTFVWPLNFPTGDIRPPRARDARTGTDFEPDPEGGEDAPAPEVRPTLRLAG
ncbi:hypothetical protein ACFYV5_03800 [Streptomyces sp. NPDC003035]|uniref:hypothetical protein n=1 Tax=Streptomyces sp. NPDC003035 TaxID=3364676 RepID=UPI0036A31434